MKYFVNNEVFYELRLLNANDRTLRSQRRHGPHDDRHAIIFDTSHQVSADRRYAFERADSVVMPFTGFLDAEIGISKAAAQLPASSILKALPVRATDDLPEQVAEWMPVMESALPDDERLILFSEASTKLPSEMAAASYDGYFDMRHLPARLFNLALEAQEFIPGPGMAPIERTPVPALLDDNARLRVPA